MAAVPGRHGIPLNGGNAKLTCISFTPFSYFLPSESHPETEIRCLEMLRDLPGKRQVYLGQWADRQIVAKVFDPHKMAGRYWQSEERGIKVMGPERYLDPGNPLFRQLKNKGIGS